MKKLNSKLSLILAVTVIFNSFLILNGITASATQSRKENFSRNYSTVSGNPGQTVANIAYAQIGKSGSTLGYTEDWCADFVADCAELAGQASAVPRHGRADYIDQYILNAGGYKVSTSNAKPGDIAFYDFNGNNSPEHVEIVYSVSGSTVRTIGGNTGNSNLYAATVCSPRTPGSLLYVIHPNYTGGGTQPIGNDNPYPEPTRNISLQSPYCTGDDVKWIQWSLVKLGYNCSIDGIYGNDTKNQVINFQKNNGLTADGIVGAGTRNKMKALTTQNSKPTYSSITVSKSIYSTDEKISIRVTASNYTVTCIGIDKDGVGRVVTQECNGSFEINASSLGEGKYSAYFSIYNNVGFIDTDRVNFEIKLCGHIMTESEGSGRTIPDGDYYIVNELNQDYFLDISGDNFDTTNKKNVGMWRWGNNNMPYKEGYDCFHFKYLNNGFYKISQINTTMCLDVADASLYNGANIWMYEDNGSNAQQWSIQKTSHGYQIRARCNAYYLDVADGKYESGTNVRCWKGNDSKAQSFSLIPRNLNEKPIADGVYTIKTNLNKSRFLDVIGEPGQFKVGSNVQIWTNGGNIYEEKYLIKYAGDGWYKIFEKTSGLIMEVVDINTNFLNASKNVQLANDNGGRNQLWKIRKNADGTYFIINKSNGYYLDLENASLDNGSNVSECAYNGSNAQKWIIELEAYTISYNMNGGSGSIGNQTKTYGQDLTLSSTKPTRTGYDFLGWNTNQSATTAQYSAGGKYTANSSATLYAIWSINKYTISYNMNGGSGSVGNQTKTYGQSLTLSSTRPTRTGYEFVGWSTDKNATTAQYQPNSQYTNNANATLYAVWKRTCMDFSQYQYSNPYKKTTYIRIFSYGTDKYVTNCNTDKTDKSYKNVALCNKNEENYNSTISQVWELQPVSSGGYKIVSFYDERYLDIVNTKSDDGTNIGVWHEYFGNDGQIWFITKKSDGKYIIQPKLGTNLYLNVQSVENNGNIQLSTKELNTCYFDIEIIKPVGQSTLTVEEAGSSSTATKFTWTAASDVTSYGVYIYDGEVLESNCIYYKQDIKGLEWSVQLKPGTYQAHLSPFNVHNWTNSNVVSFTVSQDTYTISYNSNGGSGTIPSSTVQFGDSFNISNLSFVKDGYSFIGYNVQRKSDNKWYVSNKGWYTEEQIKDEMYEKRFYQPNDIYKFDDTWIKGAISNDTYVFCAVWKSATKIVLNKTVLELGIGTSETLTAILTPENDTMTVNWESSDTNIATVDKNGVVTSVNKGTATITASLSNGEKATCVVTVKKYPDSISLNKTSTILGVGQTYTLKTIVTPADAYTTYSWSSSAKTVATVNSNGKVTAKKVGTATIKVKTINGQIATCKVTVKPAPESVALNKTSVTMGVKQTCTLTTTLTPDDSATYCTWSSSDSTVATITSAGKVTAKKVGTATITVKTSNGKTATCVITVKKAPENITLNKTSVTIGVKQTCNLTAKLSPDDSATYCSWSSSNNTIATVTSEGKVTAKKVGTVTIMVKTSNGKTATCIITVKKAPDSIALNKTATTIKVGQTETLTATLTPNNSVTYCNWSSSDKTIATVNANGVVTAKKAGAATIMVKTSNGKVAICTVTVKK